MLDARDAQAIDAAKLYYLQELSQAEVAKELGVSRPTVSKLLTHALERGYVTITLTDPRESADEIVGKLCATYGLNSARVVRPATMDDAELVQQLGNAGAAVVEELVDDGMSLGVSWGETMLSMAEHLRQTSKSGVTIVQLKGGHSHSQRSTNDLSTLTKVARAFNADTKVLPLPVILDSAQAKELVVRDRHIAQMLAAGANVDVAVFTVGDVHRESLLLNLGYLEEAEIDFLLDRAVGDACSRFYTVDGKVAAPEIDARTVGISLPDLAKRPVRICIAGGTKKVAAIAVALRMGLVTDLVIDHHTAERVLEWQSSQ